MSAPKFHNSDLEGFAEYLGFTGSDSDVFYEHYYNISDEYDDFESNWEEQAPEFTYEN